MLYVNTQAQKYFANEQQFLSFLKKQNPKQATEERVPFELETITKFHWQAWIA